MRRRISAAVALVFAVSLLAGCASQSSEWSVQVTSGIQVTGLAGMQPSLSFAKGVAAPTTLVIKDAVVGKGTPVAPGSTITVAYMSTILKNGQVIYSSWQAKHTTTIALSMTPPAWQQGLIGMKPGGTRVLIAPPNLVSAKPTAHEISIGAIVFVVHLKA